MKNKERLFSCLAESLYNGINILFNQSFDFVLLLLISATKERYSALRQLTNVARSAGGTTWRSAVMPKTTSLALFVFVEV